MIALNDVSKTGLPIHNDCVCFYIKGNNVMQVGYHSVRDGKFKSDETERTICHKGDVTHWFAMPSLIELSELITKASK